LRDAIGYFFVNSMALCRRDLLPSDLVNEMLGSC